MFSCDDLANALNIVQKSLRLNRKKHEQKLPQLKSYIKQYEDIIFEAINSTKHFQNKYENLTNNPLIAYVIKQEERIETLEEKIENLEHKISDLEYELKRHNDKYRHEPYYRED